MHNYRCAQYVDGIDKAVHSVSELNVTLEIVSQQIRNAKLKFSIKNNQHGQQSIEFLFKAISTTEVASIEK